MDAEKTRATVTSIHGFEQTVEFDQIVRGHFPASLEELMTPTQPNGEPLMDKLPRDAWGEALNYEYPSTKTTDDRPAIWSNGPNQINDNGDSDDINNWAHQNL